mmetsp:Transcript_27517/g.59221  ORF Transcript_27517/g.59221 Transcript_27517/m.59221 type:complete len:121 (+) Transcript_27517:1413-1775(+)
MSLGERAAHRGNVINNKRQPGTDTRMCSRAWTRMGATVMYIDSKSAVDMSYVPVAFKKTKHILRAAQFLRDLVAREVVYLLHVPGSVMAACILTKAVARAIFIALFKRLQSGADGLPESP